MDADKKLIYSCEQFRDILGEDTEVIRPGIGLPDWKPYPCPHILAQFASAVYDENNTSLPSGWKLLTSACNTGKTNGYFGAAYWCPSLQQVVLSHRGTILTNPGALYTNLIGVIFTNYSPRMASAITFAENLKQVLQEINYERGLRIHLSITGHSLGGWLAQVTAFTLQYLRMEGDRFCKIQDRDECNQEGLHAHTVVFDSPGCKNMLDEIVDSYDFRYRKTVSLKTLDISIYLSAPNNINTFGLHIGEVYRVLIDVSKFGLLQKHTPVYILATHSINNFVEAFENGRRIIKMLDWPVSSIKNKEYKKFHTMVNHASEYHLEPAEDDQMQLRYKPEYLENCSLRIFSVVELQFLNFWNMFIKDNMKSNVIEMFLNSYELGTVHDLLEDFEIKNHTIICNSKESLERVIKRTKQLVRWFGAELMDAVRRQSAEIPRILYFTATQNYLNFLPEFLMDFRDALGLQDFLESNSKRILYIETEDSRFEIALLHNIFSLLQKKWRSNFEEFRLLDNYLASDNHTFLDWKRMLELVKIVDFKNLHKSKFSNDNLLVVDCTSVTDIQIIKNLAEKVIKHFGENVHKKMILILSNKQNDLEIDVSVKRVTMSDLTEESQRKLLARKLVVFKNEKLSLQHCLGTDLVIKDFLKNIKKSSLIDRQRLNKIITEQNYTIEIVDPHLKFINLDVHYSKIEKEVSVKSIARIFCKYSPHVLLVIRGLSRDDLMTNGQWKELVEAEQGADRIFTTAEDGEVLFKQKCCENPTLIVYWIEVSDAHIYCKQVFDKGFYIGRRFKHTVVIDLCIVDKVIEKRDVKDLFVFQNVTDKHQLLRLVPLSREREDRFLNDSNFQTATSSEQADAIIKTTFDRPVHILMLQEYGGPRLVWRASRGSLDNLRPYVTAGVSEPIDERELCNGRKKVVIIVDEPGMGKSTSLMNMSWLIESAWVIFINLKHLQTNILPAKLSVAAVANFLLLKNHGDDSLVCKMLQHCLTFEKSIRVFLLMDGFDEIKEQCPGSQVSSQREVLRLIKFLKKKTTATILLTSREYPRKYLENELSVFATTFEEISIRHQQEFLVKFLRSHLELELEDFEEEEETKLQKYVERLYREAKLVLGVDITHFMGIPLQMRMLAEVSLSEAKLFIKSSGTAQKLFQITDVFELYQKFINTKYDIYFEDKSEISGLSSVNKNVLLKDKIKKHQMLSFLIIFPDFAKQTLKFKTIDTDDLIELNKIGLIQLSADGDADFIHRTFAEYFSAEFLVNYLSKYDELVELVLFEVLLQANYQIARMFFSYLIRLYPLKEETLQLCTEKCSQLWNTNRSLFFSQQQNAFHIAADERNEHIFDFLLRILNTEMTQEAYISLISARDLLGRTALNIAAADIDKDSFCSESDRIIFSNIMKKIISSIENCSFEFKQKLLLATFVKRRVYKILIEYLKCSKGLDAVFERTQNILNKQSYSFLEAVKENNQSTVEKIYNQMTNNTERYYLLLVADGRRDTALHIAAALGHSQLVRFLIHKNVPINVLMMHDNVGRTPLHSAAAVGHCEVVQLLVKRGADIHDLDRDDRNALSLAAFMGHLSVVKLLMQHQANLNSRDQSGRTALSLAAFKDHVSVVELLVRTGQVDINSRDLQGKSVLSWAACGGSLSVVKFLVNTGEVDINSRDREGRSALSRAASGGHLSVVEFLVSTGQSDIDSPDEHVRTPLSWAASEGQLSIVEFLVSTGKVNIHAQDEQGKSALCWAACKGRDSVVEFLVTTGQTDNNCRDVFGRTPLSWAASAGHISVVKFLIFVGHVDINSQDEQGRSALSRAACEGQKSIVEFLITNEQVDINSRDNRGRSALSWGACRRHLLVLDLLIQNEAEIILPDPESVSFLLRLACCGKRWALEHLTQHHVIVPRECKESDDIFWMPSEDLLSEVLKFLIHQKKNISSWTERGETALHTAAQNGNFPVVVFLVWQEIFIDYRDENGKTALYLASEGGYVGLVRFLLGRDRKAWATKMLNKYNAHLRWRAANPNITDLAKVTILQCACRDGKWEVAQELLDAGANVNLGSSRCRRPLQYALDAEKWSLVETMLKKGAFTINLSEEQKSKLEALNFL